MSFVNLVSGGLDSTLVGVMAKEDQRDHEPLFIDYGQRAARKEWEVCQSVHHSCGLPEPKRVDLSGFGKLILSGLTTEELHVKDEAFTPGRNMLFLLVGSAYAYQIGLSSVSIGLLSEKLSIFPDQKKSFLEKAEITIEAALGKRISVVAPLMEFTKADVVELAGRKGIRDTYSCHTGNDPCGKCIACLEFGKEKGELHGR